MLNYITLLMINLKLLIQLRTKTTLADSGDSRYPIYFSLVFSMSNIKYILVLEFAIRVRVIVLGSTAAEQSEVQL